MNKWSTLVLAELSESLEFMSDSDFLILVEKLKSSNRVVVVGVGRVLISLKAWVKRLNHLGIDIDYFGSETEKPVGEDDLVLVASSSGESIIPKEISAIAKKKGASVFYVGCNDQSSVAKASDQMLILRGKSKLDSELQSKSKQPMSTLFEQQLFLLGDMIALEVMNTKGISEDDLKYEHANLE